MLKRNKPELLIPASNLEVLKVAVQYGADAIYIGGEMYGLRAKARNFSKEDMIEGIRYAHQYGKKVYVTEVVVDSVTFLESKSTSDARQNGSASEPYYADDNYDMVDTTPTLKISSDDLPF